MTGSVMAPQGTTVERDGRSAIVHLRGDLVVPTARVVYSTLRTVAKRRDVKTVVLDFSDAGRIDSAGIAVISLIGRLLTESGKKLDLSRLHDQHRAALELSPGGAPGSVEPLETPGVIERLGDHVIDLGESLRAFWALLTETLRQVAAVDARRARIPPGSLRHHVESMGVNVIFIVGLLSFLTGMTMGFQGAVQLQRFGAGVFVADMIGVSMIRELAPLLTAVILTGRTGAAIAAELGTMRVRTEIDALATMGINPVRFLIVPRMAAITAVGPALTLIGIFIGILGGMLVAALTLDMPAVTFWSRVVDRVTLLDFVHGIGKSLVFAWIIGIVGSHLGMQASGDASSVGTATTRTVVISVFLIIVVDAVFATITTLMKH
ncbi:MAG TPA: MlaE family lipid ABC transporter permease subunit, partial [Kofleriaceae bacterium]|nr:MlaE family lipid ABC transporter permease subunit [Kofleriaceae bacterium]